MKIAIFYLYQPFSMNENDIKIGINRENLLFAVVTKIKTSTWDYINQIWPLSLSPPAKGPERTVRYREWAYCNNATIWLAKDNKVNVSGHFATLSPSTSSM